MLRSIRRTKQRIGWAKRFFFTRLLQQYCRTSSSVRFLKHRIIFRVMHRSNTNLQGYAPICLGLEDFYIRRLYLRLQGYASICLGLEDFYIRRLYLRLQGFEVVKLIGVCMLMCSLVCPEIFRGVFHPRFSQVHLKRMRGRLVQGKPSGRCCELTSAKNLVAYLKYHGFDIQDGGSGLISNFNFFCWP
ncbi:hypothetical protein QVD17_19935 [Tagetes erecta]|uniref:Uncharacterized protein n=1 Tax=Tagetes erecta TaxID=13708 RepID=A0AAD8KQN1_TARER|nr:hypothetical protein QVD17_19935 [Tagetes erecta]